MLVKFVDCSIYGMLKIAFCVGFCNGLKTLALTDHYVVFGRRTWCSPFCSNFSTNLVSLSLLFFRKSFNIIEFFFQFYQLVDYILKFSRYLLYLVISFIVSWWLSSVIFNRESNFSIILSYIVPIQGTSELKQALIWYQLHADLTKTQKVKRFLINPKRIFNILNFFFSISNS